MREAWISTMQERMANQFNDEVRTAWENAFAAAASRFTSSSRPASAARSTNS